MFDYTPENIKYVQTGEIIEQVYLANKRLGKINHSLKLLIVMYAVMMFVEYGDTIKKKLKKLKGE